MGAVVKSIDNVQWVCVGLGFKLAPTWAWARLRHRNSSKDGRLVYGGGQTLNLVKAELLHRVLKLELKRFSPGRHGSLLKFLKNTGWPNTHRIISNAYVTPRTVNGI
ncbi:hypothetical protein OIU74_008172 [Salix koriyanagi]|uniref:Uncharacterized protein n=1 Tax=Salix koriyanagi TaxID=2511006 RepID=A0A9Q0U5B5_9ROSI|nr:hypothetical protein OIU74_008172 [Salix koriyanagi]